MEIQAPVNQQIQPSYDQNRISVMIDNSGEDSSLASPAPVEVKLTLIKSFGRRTSLATSKLKRTTERVKELTLDSTAEDFQSFKSGMAHPAITLKLMTNEDDLTTVNSFDQQCNEVLTALTDLELSIQELGHWKDDFIRENIPTAIKVDLVILFTRLFRTKSNFHLPLFNMIRQVRMFSRPWVEKKQFLTKLETEYTE